MIQDYQYLNQWLKFSLIVTVLFLGVHQSAAASLDSSFLNQDYRVDHEIDYRYSSVVMAEDSTLDITLRVRNTIDEEKQLETSLEGVRAEFMSTGTSSMEYSLAGEEVKEFQVRIDPEESRKTSLNITTVNTDIGIGITDKMPVYVRNYPATGPAKEVPGVAAMNMVVILVLSTIFYFFR